MLGLHHGGIWMEGKHSLERKSPGTRDGSGISEQVLRLVAGWLDFPRQRLGSDKSAASESLPSLPSFPCPFHWSSDKSLVSLPVRK